MVELSVANEPMFVNGSPIAIELAPGIGCDPGIPSKLLPFGPKTPPGSVVLLSMCTRVNPTRASFTTVGEKVRVQLITPPVVGASVAAPSRAGNATALGCPARYRAIVN